MCVCVCVCVCVVFDFVRLFVVLVWVLGVGCLFSRGVFVWV